jgi:hypothetical protein
MLILKSGCTLSILGRFVLSLTDPQCCIFLKQIRVIKLSEQSINHKVCIDVSDQFTLQPLYNACSLFALKNKSVLRF